MTTASSLWQYLAPTLTSIVKKDIKVSYSFSSDDNILYNAVALPCSILCVKLLAQ